MASHRESDGDDQELLDFRISEDVENNEMAYMFEPRAARCRPTDNGRGPSPSSTVGTESENKDSRPSNSPDKFRQFVTFLVWWDLWNFIIIVYFKSIFDSLLLISSCRWMEFPTSLDRPVILAGLLAGEATPSRQANTRGRHTRRSMHCGPNHDN